MIEVQIAATVLEDGVADHRWVLVDEAEAPPPAAPPPTSAAPAPPLTDAASGDIVFRLARLLVLLGALGGAWAASLAILQARSTANAVLVPDDPPALVSTPGATREAAAAAAAPRAPNAATLAVASSKRSRP
jgi:hypothetical protein